MENITDKPQYSRQGFIVHKQPSPLGSGSLWTINPCLLWFIYNIYMAYICSKVYMHICLAAYKTVKVSLVPRPPGLWPGYKARDLAERLMVSYKL